jgi:hypothetical protein
MAKKVKEKKVKAAPKESHNNVKVEKALMENFVSLQKVMTNLAVNFDNLSSQISKLLELFEISAKTLAEKGVIMEDKAGAKMVEKLDSLLEQNKIIAKGIALIHEKNSEPVVYNNPEPPAEERRPVQYLQQQPSQPRRVMEMNQKQQQEIPRNPKFRTMSI